MRELLFIIGVLLSLTARAAVPPPAIDCESINRWNLGQQETPPMPLNLFYEINFIPTAKSHTSGGESFHVYMAVFTLRDLRTKAALKPPEKRAITVQISTAGPVRQMAAYVGENSKDGRFTFSFLPGYSDYLSTFGMYG